GPGGGLWRAQVTALAPVDTSPVRDLIATAPFLGAPMVGSEVFARCDAPSVTVRWSDFEVVTDRGDRVVPAALTANYQSHADGGCANTASVADDRGGVLQITNTHRVSTTSDTIRFPR